MKKIIAFIVSILIVFSCAISTPSWTNIGSDKVYIENYRDTVEFVELDSILNTHNIHPTSTEWSTMKYYTPEKEEMTQFVYTKKDTTFIVNKTIDGYIFLMRYLNKYNE
jgi:uncharacterized protein YxeA